MPRGCRDAFKKSAFTHPYMWRHANLHDNWILLKIFTKKKKSMHLQSLLCFKWKISQIWTACSQKVYLPFIYTFKVKYLQRSIVGNSTGIVEWLHSKLKNKCKDSYFSLKVSLLKVSMPSEFKNNCSGLQNLPCPV